eukprot:m.518331 g.518331  ORF g.518331 m.518331 type:complete len:2056 (-) comp57486_c0_seq1:163-6330(-)
MEEGGARSRAFKQMVSGVSAAEQRSRLALLHDTDTHETQTEESVRPPDLEQILTANEQLVSEHSFSSLFEQMNEDFEMVRVQKMSRSAPSVPQGALADATNLLVKTSLEFYCSDWHLVQYKHDSTTMPCLPALSHDLEAQAFEIDSGRDMRNGSSRDQIGTLSTEPIKAAFLLKSPSLGQALLRAKKGAEGHNGVPALSKWKKRYCVLRFRTSSGPLVLEVTKDKHSVVKETLELTELEAVDKGPDNIANAFRIVFRSDTLYFGTENEDDAVSWTTTIQQKIKEMSDHERRVTDEAKREPSIYEARRSMVNEFEAVRLEDVYLNMIDHAKRETFSQRQSKRKEVAKDRIFGLYQQLDGEFDHIVEQSPEFLEEQPGCRFSVTCQSLLMEMNITDGSVTRNPEPFFCSLALYDAVRGTKISENFYFEFNDSETNGPFEQVLNRNDIDVVTRARSAVFSTSRPSIDFYLVLRIEKILQTDVNSASTIYVKGAGNDKAARQHEETVLDYASRLGSYKMPFGWAARPVYQPSGSLDMLSEFSPIFRLDKLKLSDDDLIKSLQEMHKYRGALAKLKWAVIPGVFTMKVHGVDPAAPLVTPALLSVLPAAPKHVIPVREVQSFDYEDARFPNLSYHNFLYVYPTHIDFSGITSASSRARNITCRVELLEGDEMMMGGRCVFGRSMAPKFTNHALTTVFYHCPSTSMYDEIKLALPIVITARHHLLFTFFHVSVDSQKRDKTQSVVGYAWLPILQEQGRLDGSFELPVASAGQATGESALLPPNYLKYGGPKSDQDITKEPIKWIDGGKRVFQVSLRCQSSVYSSDDHLRRFFLTAQLDNTNETGVRSLRDRVKALHAVSTGELFRFFPILFNQLFSILSTPRPPSSSASDLNEQVVRYLVFAVDLISSILKDDVIAGQNRLLRCYLDHVFNVKHGTSSPNTVHEQLTKYLYQYVISAENTLQDQLYKSLWFFLGIIAKSTAQYLLLSEDSLLPRTQRFTKAHTEDVRILAGNFVAALSLRANRDLATTTAINAALATHFKRLFSYFDRGFVLALIEHTLSAMPTQLRVSHLVHCKFLFLESLCVFEHYLALSYPILTETNVSIMAPLSRAYCQSHYLSGILLTELMSVLNLSDTLLRRNAIKVFRNVLAYHEFDPRLQSAERRSQTAAMYFPLIYLLMSKISSLRSHEGESSLNLLFEQEETQDLLICLLYILKSLSTASLLAWLSQNSIDPTFLDLLALCVKVFEYKGRDHSSKGSSAVSATAQRLKLLEAPYASPSTSSTDGVGFSGVTLTRQTTARRKDEDWTEMRSISTPEIRPGTRTLRMDQEPGTLEKRHTTLTLMTPLYPRESDDEGRRNRFTTYGSNAKNTLFKLPPRQLAMLSMNLSSEVSLIVLEVIELILHHFAKEVAVNSGDNVVAQRIFHIIKLMFRSGLSETIIPHFFLSLNSCLVNFFDVIWHKTSAFCQDLCLQTLYGCNSKLGTMQEHSCALLYSFISLGQKKISSGRLSLELMIALSKIAGATDRQRHDSELLWSLDLILTHAVRTKENKQLVDQVNDLRDKMRTVLIDTKQLKKFEQDPEMYADLQYRVAKSYATSPELRVTWLGSLAKFHEKQGNWSEVAMCVLHAAAIINDHITLNESSERIVPGRLSSFAHLSRNIPSIETCNEHATSSSSIFSERGFVHLIQLAIKFLKKGQRHELLSAAYDMIMPLWHKQAKYKELSAAFADLHAAYDQIIAYENEKPKRILGTFYRVAFFGPAFEELNGQEFIYKEPQITQLSEIALRLETMLQAKYGQIEVIRDAGREATAHLDPGRLYFQVTHVVPYFSEAEKVARQTNFQRNHNISRFSYEVLIGRPTVAERSIEKIILTVEDGIGFPFVKKRLLVVKRERQLLGALDAAIEEMQRKGDTLEAVVKAAVPNKVLLQLQLQGIVSLQVHSGPMEFANVFLVNSTQFDPARIAVLRQEFVRMAHFCNLAVEISAKLTSGEKEQAYQDDLKKKNAIFQEALRIYIDEGSPRGSGLSNFLELIGRTQLVHSTRQSAAIDDFNFMESQDTLDASHAEC